MTKPNSQPSHFVLYRTGGTDWCTWQRLFERYSLEAARAKQDELMRMGYQALVQSAEQLERIGMPYGWSAQSVDWSADEIKTDHDKHGIPCKTVHIKAQVAA